jgi:hypothetical protein
MAKRMRRTSQVSTDRPGTAETIADTAKDMSVSAVKVATEAAKAALSGMQELGRTMGKMAAPAARQGVKMASDVTRATMDSTRKMTRSAASTARQATRSTTRAASGRRKSRKRRAA